MKTIVQKKWILVTSIIAIIVIISGIGIYFFSDLSGDQNNDISGPPVDFSGINLPSSLTGRELLPDELMNEPFKIENLAGGWIR